MTTTASTELTIGIERVATFVLPLSASTHTRSIEATISHLDFSDEEYAIILARDISERARAEKERTRREEENRRLSLIAARTSNAVILTDRSGVIEWVNEGFVRR